MAKSIKIY